MRSVGIILAIWSVAGPALAADRVCSGEAKGDGQEVSVNLWFDGRKQPGSRSASWDSPAVGAPVLGRGLTAPKLHIAYDLDGDRLGRVSVVAVAASAEVDPRPASATAMMVVGLDGGRSWTAPWGMFAQNVARLDEVRFPKGAQPAGFFGVVPVARSGDGGAPVRNPELLTAITAARSATIRVVGDAPGETFGEAAYDLSGIASRDALFATAYAQAAAAAANPGKCRKAAN